VSRQALFSGTEVPPAHLDLDRGAVAAYLAGRLPGFAQLLDVVKFKGGQSNPTYLLETDAGRYVLRRKPPGALVKSAHAIDREYRAMAALDRVGFPVAKPLLYCDDEAVIGSEFFVAAFVDGRVFWDADLPGVSPADRARLYDAMNQAFATLHDTDPVSAGLGDLGRSDGYVARNLARWSDIYRRSQLVDIPDMDWLADALPERSPVEAPSALIHGDYGLYNIIVAPEAPSILAILDWEMATIGDPYVDLAHHLRAWWDIPDPAGSATSLRGLDLDALGIPTMEEYATRYFSRRGIAAPDMTFYLAFAQFRYAAMIQGILKRAADGTAASRVMLHRQERVAEIAALARSTLAG
jgi:aminoglycoside phosphotransferase (APT) family kinase protein